MMEWTDRHCRAFHRTLTRRALLFTEMVTADAVIHGDRQRLLGFDAGEHPVALQLGGSEPEKLARAARIGADFGYDEINLNCGCPSQRVQSGAFGACLMREPELVANCFHAMQGAVKVPVTVKCRIGIDDDPPAETLFRFVDTLAEAGCEVFTVHARKAWLKGLSPKENREIPPLDYKLVETLRCERRHLTFILNGGIASLAEARRHLADFDGVMLGRAAYQTPALLAGVDRMLDDFDRHGPGGQPEANVADDTGAPPRDRLVSAVLTHREYIAGQLARGTPLHAMTRHMLGLFSARPGARIWRRTLSEKGVRSGAGLDVLDEALAAVAEGAQRIGA